MNKVSYRQSTMDDITSLAKIRSMNWESEAYWKNRISGYLAGTQNPQQALEPRIIYVALMEDEVIGFVAGHLTRRFDCEGELEWIDVIEPYRRLGIASELLAFLAKWFIGQKAHKICVDPGNEIARLFYARNKAINLNRHWMLWPDISVIL